MFEHTGRWKRSKQRTRDCVNAFVTDKAGQQPYGSWPAVLMERRTGLEPATTSLEGWGSTN